MTTLAVGLDLVDGGAVRAPLPHALEPALASSTAVALVTENGLPLTYVDLRDRVGRLVGRLPHATSGRRLVHIPLRRDVATVTAYLATVAAGHVALVTGDDERTSRILQRYRPDLRATADDDEPFEVLSSGPLHVLHPDLVLLLSTSGSTGSPKLVRLSHGNLAANAAAIAEALRLTVDDTAITSLPLHYSFGLSVLHSHLLVGGSVVLHEGSVLDAGFWDAADTHGVTTLAVVPHMVGLLESTGALERPHPSLRLVAQAGGRMPPDQVARTAALGREHGWELAVMYGQTEATARICVLDPALVAENPDAVGRPLTGTTLHLDTGVPEATDGAGEVVVRGPGVMMGYAEHPDDLALGALLTELRTGDLGRVDDAGLLRIVGRRSGFVKIMGLRVDLAGVEAALEAAGLTPCVTGDDAGLRVAVEPQPGVGAAETAARARRLAGESSGVGPAAVAVAVVPLARFENGKVDRNGCDALVRADTRDECAGTRRRLTEPPDGQPTAATRLATGLGRILGGHAVDLDRSFVEQGGDSLSHVQASVLLEGIVGPLPRGWHQRPLRDLLHGHRSGQDQLRDATATEAAAAAPARGGPAEHARRLRDRLATLTASAGWRTVETSVVLRAVAVVIICGSHAELFRALGGAHTLLAVAGFNAARFGLSVPTASGRWRGSARMLVGIAVPTVAIVLVGMLTHGRYGWGNVVMANWLVGDVTYGFHNELWFIDALAASLVLLTAILSLPPIARAWRQDPWRVTTVIAALALVPRFVILELGEGVLRGLMPTTFWLFAVGASVATATTTRRRVVTLALAVLGGATFFEEDPARNMTILVGVALLALVPEVRLPARLLPVITLLAAASLHVYLIQFPILGAVTSPWVATAAAITAGCLLWRATARPVRRLQGLVPPHT